MKHDPNLSCETEIHPGIGFFFQSVIRASNFRCAPPIEIRPISIVKRIEGSGTPTGASDPEIKLSRLPSGARKVGLEHPAPVPAHSGPPEYPTRVLTGRKRFRNGNVPPMLIS